MQKYFKWLALLVIIVAFSVAVGYALIRSGRNKAVVIPAASVDLVAPINIIAPPGVAPASAPILEPEAPINQAAKAVTIQDLSFKPSTISVKKGGIVTWTNNDAMIHQIKSDAFDSGPLEQGRAFSFVFNKAGIFEYYCALHPSMTGRIIVE